MLGARVMASGLAANKTAPFQVVSKVSKLREWRRDATRVGLVPTMGALHDGHLALIRQAAKENTDVYVSIYVNPTQFGVHEDLGSYPRTWPSDELKLKNLHAEFARDEKIEGQIRVIFMPNTKEMYPGAPPTSEVDGAGSFVTITPLGGRLEGASRPVFFRGVATVCMKLFNIVQPDNVYFGQKDIQQTFVIKRMVQDFHLNTNVRIGPTIREQDGLAMSSRNVYLGFRRRKVALSLLQALESLDTAYKAGVTMQSELIASALTLLSDLQDRQRALPTSQRALFDVDYISVADPRDLEEVREVEPQSGCIVSGAIKMLPLEDVVDGEVLGLGGDRGPVRLIDNLILDPLLPKV